MDCGLTCISTRSLQYFEAFHAFCLVRDRSIAGKIGSGESGGGGQYGHGGNSQFYIFHRRTP